MKRILFLFNVLICGTLMAQEGSVGIGTQSPNENAVLHLVAPNNDQGLLIPKLTTVQRTNFSSQLTTTENGMMVYDSDLDQFFFWMTDHWEAVGSSLQAGTGVEITNGVINNTGDTDASDDFSGDWADLLNVPTGFADGVDEVNDADSDPANELQDLNLAGDILTISGLSTPTEIDLSAYIGTNTDEQDLQFTAGQVTLTGDPDNTIIDLSAYDNDASDDFSGDWADLLNVPVDFTDGVDDVDDADADPTNEIELPSTAITGQVLKFDGTSWIADTDAIDDADNDPANELQDLQLVDDILTITNLASPNQINLSAYTGTNTDEQDLQLIDGSLFLSSDPTPEGINLSSFNTDLLATLSGEDGYVVKYSDVDGGWTAAPDGDSDPNNEIQDLELSDGSLVLSGDDTPVSLSAYFDNTDLLADVVVTPEDEGAVLKYFPVDGGWQPGVDLVDDADADPTNEIQDISTDGTAGNIGLSDGSTLTLNVNDGDNDPNNEIEFPSETTTGYVMKFNGTSWTPQADATGGSSSPWNEGSDTFGSFVEYGGRAKALNLIGASVVLTEIELSEPILKQEIFKSAKTILVNVVDGVTLNGIDPGITGQEVTFINIGSGQITFDNRSTSNLFLPASTITLSQGGTLTLMFVQEEKTAFSGWVPLSGVASPTAPGK